MSRNLVEIVRRHHAALAGYAVGADHGFVLTRSKYPRSNLLAHFPQELGVA